MSGGQDDIPIPRLREGWDAPPPAAPVGPGPAVPRHEKERRDLTMALVVFLVAALLLLVLGHRSLALPAFGVATGWAIRLLLLQRKLDRLRGGG
jgi:hypothetical protein